MRPCDWPPRTLSTASPAPRSSAQLGRFAEGDSGGRAGHRGQRLQRCTSRRGPSVLWGTFWARETQPDFKRAIQYHTLAIKTATELKTSPHPAIRVPGQRGAHGRPPGRCPRHRLGKLESERDGGQDLAPAGLGPRRRLGREGRRHRGAAIPRGGPGLGGLRGRAREARSRRVDREGPPGGPGAGRRRRQPAPAAADAVGDGNGPLRRRPGLPDAGPSRSGHEVRPAGHRAFGGGPDEQGQRHGRLPHRPPLFPLGIDPGHRPTEPPRGRHVV